MSAVRIFDARSPQLSHMVQVKKKVPLAKMRRGSDMQPVYVKDGDVAPQQRAAWPGEVRSYAGLYRVVLRA